MYKKKIEMKKKEKTFLFKYQRTADKLKLVVGWIVIILQNCIYRHYVERRWMHTKQD